MSENSTRKEWLNELIKKRRTRKPIYFDTKVSSEIIEYLIDIARNAPNHHRTEPARFYILDSQRIRKVGKLFNEVISGDSSDSALIEKGLRKEKEWGNSTGLLVITSYTDENSLLIRKNPTVVQENYATTCCIIQNLLLLFESNNISAKWSTGPVWGHPSFPPTIGMKDPQKEKVVALIFYGVSNLKAQIRTLSPLNNFIVNHSK